MYGDPFDGVLPALFAVLGVTIAVFWLVNYYFEAKRKPKREIKNEMKWKYKDIKIGDTLTLAINKFGRDYSIEKEIKENDKSIKVLKWYAFEYSDSGYEMHKFIKKPIYS